MTGRIVWTDNLRFGLLQVFADDSLDAQDRCKVFNEVFEDHLRSCLNGGLLTTEDHGKLRAQYNEHEKSSRWNAAKRPPASDEAAADRVRIQRQVAIVVASLHKSRTTTPVRRTDLLTPPDTPNDQPQLRASSRPGKASKRSLQEEPATPASIVSSRKKRRITRTVTPLPTRTVTPLPARSPGHGHIEITHPSRLEADGRIRVPRPRNGPDLLLTRAQYALSQMPLIPVSATSAAPPRYGLFYRYWDENSHGLNSDRGHVAGRFMYTNNAPPQAPKSTDVEDTDVENHINRNPVASPFISVSNCLVWIIRLALKEAQQGAQNGRISILDADGIQDIYHVNAYWRELKKTFCFTNGAWRYGGLHEFLVWSEIPQHAVLRTVGLDDLVDFVSVKPTLAEALSFELIGQNKDFKSKICADLEASSKGLSAGLISGIARLAVFMGVDATSSPKQLEHFVSDIVQGWVVKVRRQTPSQWAEYADIFAHVLCGRRFMAATSHHIKMSFLAGVRGGLGDFNTLHSAAKIRQMERRAEAVGLASPASVMLESLQDARREIEAYEQDMTQRLQTGGKRAACIATADDAGGHGRFR